jgi:hypothetical protein
MPAPTLQTLTTIGRRWRMYGAIARISACFLAQAATGCATAPAVFGARARFSPAFQGYVMAAGTGSDDPGAAEEVLVLRDPLTGKKLRCREDVVEWRELHEDLAADRVRDDNVAVAAAVTGSVLFGPLVVVHSVGGLVMAEALLTTSAIFEDLRSHDATKLLARGIVFYRRERYW